MHAASDNVWVIVCTPVLMTVVFVQCSYHNLSLAAQAVYTVLREAELRSTAPIPYWNVPLLAALDPRQRRVSAALAVVNKTLDGLIARCQKLVRVARACA